MCPPKRGSHKTYHYGLAHICSLDPAPRHCPTQPSSFDFDQLFKLDGPLAVQAYLIFTLLHQTFSSSEPDDLHLAASALTPGEFGT
ncbi:hypothetical protein H4582DRAFT_2092555 [Lactarius indigo]|nr:hypothetical protein H4582DRAFT_2092555 [Lactarius indigo]